MCSVPEGQTVWVTGKERNRAQLSKDGMNLREGREAEEGDAGSLSVTERAEGCQFSNQSELRAALNCVGVLVTDAHGEIRVSRA